MNKQRLAQSLSKMTVENGCTEAEAKTAREKLAKLRGETESQKKAADGMEKYKSRIAAEERARKIVAAKAAAAEAKAKWDYMMRDWIEEDKLDQHVGNYVVEKDGGTIKIHRK